MGLPKEAQEEIPKQQMFRKCLRQWKGTIAFPSPAEGLQILDQLDRYIAEDVASALKPCRRREYSQKAELVATLGEVRESLGEQYGKQKTMHRYAGIWGGHGAFLRELENLGMK